MRVVLEAPLFASRQVVLSPFTIPRLLDLCLEQECHTLEIEPPEAPEFQAWRSALREEEREALDFLLDESVQRLVRDPPAITIRVADVSEIEWGDEPRFPLAKATALLGRPLRILLEGVNDEEFLKTTVPNIYRERFEDWVGREFLKIEHRGGLQNLHHVIEQECEHPERRLRLFVMFDSDARKRDTPSPASRKVARLCERRKLFHHQLQRRAIENYIPVPALERWLKQSHSREFDTTWLPRLRAFRGLTQEQRHHYNMKHGSKKDRESAEGLADLFDGLGAQTPDPTPHLEGGFGENVARAFHEAIPEAWFVDDGQHPELMNLFKTLLRAA